MSSITTKSAKALNDTFPLIPETAESTSAALNGLLEVSDEIFIKKMSLNDWEWTEKSNKHQNGPLIPAEQRDSGFFPALKEKPRNPGEKPINEVYFDVLWLQPLETLRARLVHYGSKNETHLTGVPKGLFTGILPASFVLIGRKKMRGSEGYSYCGIVIDSGSEEAEFLVDLFEIQPTFVSGIFDPSKASKSFEDCILDFVEQALAAFKAGNLKRFAKEHGILPRPDKIAAMAQEKFRQQNPTVSNFSPFQLECPGDYLMELSRGIEFEIFREYELKHRSLELVQVILGDDPGKATVEHALCNIIREFHSIDKILLSASQTRKSRAGKSFEIHIEALLKNGDIPYKRQVIMKSRSRPDFVLPTLQLYKKKSRPSEQVLVLSAKTTLRERWKQVQSEINNCDLYLATVDENIAENAIVQMKAAGIQLVVPESLKKSKSTAYEEQDNVLSFKTFFDEHIKNKRYPLWAPLGLVTAT